MQNSSGYPSINDKTNGFFSSTGLLYGTNPVLPLCRIYCTVYQDRNTNLYGYTDDHTVNQLFDPSLSGDEELTLISLSRTFTQIQSWMSENRLKLNPNKTELIYFGSRHSLEKTLNYCVWLAGSHVYRLQVAKYLGVHLDEVLSFKHQITMVCAKAQLNLARICGIRKYLSQEMCKILVQSLVVSHLDYANVCYAGLPNQDIMQLQHIQNQAAKLVFLTKTRDSTTQCLKDLHWLLVKQCIQFKILTLVYQGLSGQGPVYIQNMFRRRNLRPTCQYDQDVLLEVPFTVHTTFADCSLSVLGPRLWNSLLTKEAHTAASLDHFKKSVKTILFAMAYV